MAEGCRRTAAVAARQATPRATYEDVRTMVAVEVSGRDGPSEDVSGWVSGTRWMLLAENTFGLEGCRGAPTNSCEHVPFLVVAIAPEAVAHTRRPRVCMAAGNCGPHIFMLKICIGRDRDRCRTVPDKVADYRLVYGRNERYSYTRTW